MDTLLVAVLVAGVTLAELLIIRGEHRKRVARQNAIRPTFQGFSRLHSGVYRDQSLCKDMQVEFKTDGSPAVLMLYTTSIRHIDLSDYARISIVVKPRAAFDARVVLKPPVGDLLGNVGRMIMDPVARLGVQEIDNAYTVRTSDPNLARGVLTAPAVRAGLAANVGAELRATGNEVWVEVEGEVDNPGRLEGMLDLGTAVVAQLKAMGLVA